MDMDIEADLGIDSIKRVEILSALETAFPALAGADRSRMGTLRTLGDFRDILRPTSDNTAPSHLQVRSAPVREESVKETTPPSDSFPRQVVRVAEAPALGFALSGLREASPLVILISEQPVHEDETRVALTLAEGLREQGLEVEVSAEVPPNTRGVIFLGGLRPVSRVEEAIAIQRDAFHAARQFAKRAEQGGVFVIVQDTGGDFGMSGCGLRAWLGGLPGLVKTAVHEWPTASLKAIDLERAGRSPETLASVLLTELLAGGPEVEVGLRADGSRVTLRCEPAQPCSPGEAASFVRDGDVIVVSGGARGVTASCVLELARQYKLRLVLLGRTPLGDEPPGCKTARTESELVQALVQGARQAGGAIRLENARARARQVLQQREIEENLAALRHAGAEIRYLPVDVRDQAALGASLAQVRQSWGPITGLIHGAGVLADRLIKDKTPEQFDQVFSVKVDGLRSLLEATSSDPLRLLCLFSSVAARVGNSGQSDYSMANEVLNKVAADEQARRGKDCLVKAINWGAWEGGMVTPALKERFEARGVRLLPLEEGGRQLAAELTAAEGVEMVLGVADFTDPLKVNRGAATTFDVVVEPERWAFLRSHCVEEGVPVVPMVLVLEWFVRAGRVIWPGQEVSCRDLKVLAGVQLRDFERGHWFCIVCRPTAAEVLEVELHSDGGRHYSAVLAPAPQDARSLTRPRWRKGKASSVLPRPARSAYEDGLLFHGPHFQVLRTLDDLSGKEVGADLHGTDEVGWGAGPWLTDPATLDGGLQLAILWALHNTNRKSLPTRFEAFVPLGASGARARRCDLQVRQSGRHETVADLLFSEADGRPVAELRGVTMTLFLNGNHKVA
jgi:NAD(P)-dependent dehydrogenase (short-subunit alcohol dehydrogenase family)